MQILQQVVPLKCRFCQRSTSTTVCHRCAQDWRTHIRPSGFYVMQNGLRVHAMSMYRGVNAQAIQTMKSSRYGAVDPFCFDYLKNLIQDWVTTIHGIECHAIVPLPSQPMRRFLGTDLSLIFARVLCQYLGLPLHDPLRIRGRLGGLLSTPQKQLSRADRMRRHDRFQIRRYDPFAFDGIRRVLLVDDVCTTGASLASARSILSERGIECEMLVLAMTPYSGSRS